MIDTPTATALALAESIKKELLYLADSSGPTDHAAQGILRARSFSELHDVIDANDLGDCLKVFAAMTDNLPDDEERAGKLDGAYSVIDEAQTLVDVWIKAGGLDGAFVQNAAIEWITLQMENGEYWPDGLLLDRDQKLADRVHKEVAEKAAFEADKERVTRFCARSLDKPIITVSDLNGFAIEQIAAANPQAEVKLALWVEEFGADYAVPAEILALVDSGTLEDESFGNDICPSFCFGKMVSTGDEMHTHRLWVDHIDPARRDEYKIGDARFWIIEEETNDTVLHTDNVDEVVTFIQRVLVFQTVQDTNAQSDAQSGMTRIGFLLIICCILLALFVCAFPASVTQLLSAIY